MKPLDRLVGHCRREAEVLLLGHADYLVVFGDERIVLAGLAAEDAPEVVEAPGVGPQVERACGTLLLVGRHVPLAEGTGTVAVHLQDLRDRRRALGACRGVAGPTTGELADRAEANGMVVASCKQGRPRRRAQRRHVEPVVLETALRHTGEVRRIDRSAESAGIPEAGVVDEDEEDVRCALWRA